MKKVNSPFQKLQQLIRQNPQEGPLTRSNKLNSHSLQPFQKKQSYFDNIIQQAKHNLEINYPILNYVIIDAFQHLDPLDHQEFDCSFREYLKSQSDKLTSLKEKLMTERGEEHKREWVEPLKDDIGRQIQGLRSSFEEKNKLLREIYQLIMQRNQS